MGVDPLVGRDVGGDGTELACEEGGEGNGDGGGEEGLEEEGKDGAEAEGAEQLAAVVERGGQRGGEEAAEAGPCLAGQVEREAEEVEGEEEEEAAVVARAHAGGEPDAVVVVPADVEPAVGAVLLVLSGVCGVER